MQFIVCTVLIGIFYVAVQLHLIHQPLGSPEWNPVLMLELARQRAGVENNETKVLRPICTKNEDCIKDRYTKKAQALTYIFQAILVSYLGK